MTLETDGWLRVSGGILVALALLIWWRTSRYDVKGAAIDSVWQIARGRRTKHNPTAIEDMVHQIGSAPTHLGKARRTVFTVLGHFIAQALAVAALFMDVVGAVLLVVGSFCN
ncbi:MAG: hypothetical protein ACR2OF_06465 [Hyphomicrobium sp.]